VGDQSDKPYPGPPPPTSGSVQTGAVSGVVASAPPMTDFEARAGPHEPGDREGQESTHKRPWTRPPDEAPPGLLQANDAPPRSRPYPLGGCRSRNTSRSRQSGTAISAPYRSAISAGSGSTWRPHPRSRDLLSSTRAARRTEGTRRDLGSETGAWRRPPSAFAVRACTRSGICEGSRRGRVSDRLPIGYVEKRTLAALPTGSRVPGQTEYPSINRSITRMH
jgi:hypothetical protein